PLGREGLVPTGLAKTHPVYKSPHVASITQTVIAIVIVVLFMLIMGTDDPNKQAYLGIYGLMALVGTLLIMFAQAVVSIAIMRYFLAEHPEDFNWFTTGLCPIIAFLAQIYIIYLLWA